MGILFTEGFDAYGTGADLTLRWRDSNAPGSMSFVTGHDGGKAWRLGPNTAGEQTAARRFHPSSNPQTVIFGFWYRASSYNHSNNRAILYLEDNSVFICSLHHTAANPGVIQACRGSGGTTVLASGGSLAVDTWHHIECKITLANSGGVFIVKQDGSEIINFTGDTTAGSEFAVAIRFYGTNTSNGVNRDVDHLWACDNGGSLNNDFLGQCKVRTLFPSGAGASTQWTPNSGSNHQQVDEIGQDGDTSYVAAATAGNKDLYAFDDLGATDSPKAVGVIAVTKKDDGTARTFATTMRSNATDADGATYTQTTSYDYVEQFRDTDPDTSAAWTKSAVDALQAGVKVVS